MQAFEKVIAECITLDLETDRIESRPVYPPKPVGLAVRYPDGVSMYMSWGHPSGNNCTLEDVIIWLEELWQGDEPLLFYNAKFDLAVFYEKMGLPILPWERIHDAMFLSFLADPHSKSLSLKDLAEDLLDWAPDEQDAVANYVWENRVALVEKYGHKITRAKKGANSSGAWISKCPAEIVEPYAIGDVDRTHGLLEHLYPIIADYGMLKAYDRERKILPVFMENERDGMHVDLPALVKDVPLLQKSLARADELLCEMLGCPDLNIDSDRDLAEALHQADVIHADDWVITKSGQRSVAKDNLPFSAFQDKEVGHLYFYRNRLTTALSTFLVPWLDQASKRDGVISTNWNQVRGGQGGTRTGRPSTSNPNFLNIPKEFKQDYDMPVGNEYGLEPLPFVRDYILPDPGHVFLHRDFDGQEMRIFAHYEGAEMLEKYLEEPGMCPHIYVRDAIVEMFDIPMEKAGAKTLNFQGLYGGGLPALMGSLDCTRAEATQFKKYHNEVLPGREKLNNEIKKVLRTGEPIRTWGDRCYFCEPAKLIGGKKMDFHYKMINYLCQGSAADVTKEAIIRWWYHPRRTARFLVMVFDEINISCPADEVVEQMGLLRECMEGIEMDLEMRSSGKSGPSWGKAKAYDDNC